ncbi:nucleotidyltransferase family protein [Candidatus Magnetomonas plexicatena]|uniref:nucleotidyltransferase family protein n=1 Tax=Candidatus Magnetomonas plexicatena TaxID=2552947 RepID=UPI001C78693A|nr:nucleotidyltransferase family protein [Nitrospirales bacterium LBB_01]
MDKKTILETILTNRQLLSRYQVRSIALFGSYVRDEQRDNSDIDFLVEFNEGAKNFDNFMDLKFFLEDLFGRKVDLVTVQALRPQLKESILREITYV